MVVRALDNLHDFTFGKSKSNYLDQNREIAQNVETRLLSWYNDCFFDTEAGINWANMGKETEGLKLQIHYTILNTTGVVKINSFDANIDSNRKLTISANIDTLFSRNYQLEIEV